MADLPPERDSAGDDTGRAPGAPRWVKVFAVVAIVLVLLFAVLHLTGGGFRGHAAP